MVMLADCVLTRPQSCTSTSYMSRDRLRPYAPPVLHINLIHVTWQTASLRAPSPAHQPHTCHVTDCVLTRPQSCTSTSYMSRGRLRPHAPPVLHINLIHVGRLRPHAPPVLHINLIHVTWQTASSRAPSPAHQPHTCHVADCVLTRPQSCTSTSYMLADCVLTRPQSCTSTSYMSRGRLRPYAPPVLHINLIHVTWQTASLRAPSPAHQPHTCHVADCVLTRPQSCTSTSYMSRGRLRPHAPPVLHINLIHVGRLRPHAPPVLHINLIHVTWQTAALRAPSPAHQPHTCHVADCVLTRPQSCTSTSYMSRGRLRPYAPPVLHINLIHVTWQTASSRAPSPAHQPHTCHVTDCVLTRPQSCTSTSYMSIALAAH